MLLINSFGTVHPWVSNVKGVVAPVGEPSPKALTYSREIGTITKPAYDNITLLVMDSKRDGTYAPADIRITDRLLEISAYLYQQSIQGSLSEDLSVVTAMLSAQFGTVANFVAVGKMTFTGAYWFPESLTISFRNLDEDNVVRIWYADEAFRTQCDIYEILVIAPVDNVNLLHGQRAAVFSLLDSQTPEHYTTRIQQLTQDRSQTTLVPRTFDWTDPVDPTITKSSYFTAIVYGGAGNNEDLIREAFIDYLLTNSTYTREEWELIYPDLFKPLEFFITPIWDRYSLSNQLTYAGVYSPTLPLRDVLGYGNATFHAQPATHIQEWLAVTGSIYKSLPFVSVGNWKNRRNLFSFEQLWPQYAAISTTSFDFNRMSLATQQFVMHLVEHLKYAEEVTLTSDIPSGYTLVKRGQHHYLSKTFDKVVYLVWPKFNAFPEIGDPDVPVPADFALQLTRNYDEATGTQSVSAVLRQVGDPNPYNPAVVVDWNLVGNWANIELQDGNSTQLIPVTITNSDSGSAVHTVTAEFTVGGVALSVSGQVTLLANQTPAVSYQLVGSYNAEDTSIRAQVMRNGILITPSELEGEILFTAIHDAWNTEIGPRETYTAHPDFIMDVQNVNTVDGPDTLTYTVTATFTPFGGAEITLTDTIPNVTYHPVLDESLDFSYDRIDDTNIRFRVITTNDGQPVTLPNACYFEICSLTTGNKVFVAAGNDAILPVEEYEELVAIRFGYTQSGTTKRRAHLFSIVGAITEA
jgi:hypothetical protein